MTFNKTQMTVINNIIDGVTQSFGCDLKDYIDHNLDLVIGTLQLVNDFDLEPLVHSSLFTLWKISDQSQEDHVNEWKEFIFSTIHLSNQHFNGDVSQLLQNGVPQEDEDEEIENDFIDDEVYGDVNPEDLEHLKTCFSL